MVVVEQAATKAQKQQQEEEEEESQLVQKRDIRTHFWNEDSDISTIVNVIDDGQYSIDTSYYTFSSRQQPNDMYDACLDILEEDLHIATGTLLLENKMKQLGLDADNLVLKSQRNIHTYIDKSKTQINQYIHDQNNVIQSNYGGFYIPSLENIDKTTGIPLLKIEKSIDIPLFTKAYEYITQPLLMNGYGYTKGLGYEVTPDIIDICSRTSSRITITDEEKSVQGTVDYSVVDDNDDETKKYIEESKRKKKKKKNWKQFKMSIFSRGRNNGQVEQSIDF